MEDHLWGYIKIFLEVERLMPNPFDPFFSPEARAKRNPTREETVYNAQRIREETARSDFSSVWPNISVEYGGVMDANVPEWYYQECLKLQGHKEVVVIPVPGTATSIGRDESGNVFIYGERQIPAAAWPAFLRIAYSITMGVDMPEEGAYPAQSSSNIIPQVKDDRPTIQANQKRNEDALALALANQQRYQDDLGRAQLEEWKRRKREERNI